MIEQPQVLFDPEIPLPPTTDKYRKALDRVAATRRWFWACVIIGILASTSSIFLFAISPTPTEVVSAATTCIFWAVIAYNVRVRIQTLQMLAEGQRINDVMDHLTEVMKNFTASARGGIYPN